MKNPRNTDAFKEQAIVKGLNRGNRSLKEISVELNLGLSTLTRWMRNAALAAPSSPLQGAQRPQDWTVQERLAALAESHRLAGEELNAWCRNRGLFAHHLSQWRAQFCKLSMDGLDTNVIDNRTLKQENVRLQRELQRKEKALAEAAALLILQKKFQALWEDAEK